MNAMQIFEYKQNPVRMIERDGEPWWVLKDVCEALELLAPARVAARLDDDEKGVHKTHTLGGEQEMTVINEPGLYKVILRSNKPEAKAFTRWLTHEVLPQIRRTGGYGGDLGAVTARLDELTAEVKRLAESRHALPEGDSGYAAWARGIFRKLDYISMKRDRGETREEQLHALYVAIGACYNVDLAEERRKRGVDSTLRACYLNERLKRIVETSVEYSVGMV